MPRRESTFAPGCRAVGALLLAVLAAAGCGPQTASVSGSVKFKGEPLPSGTVLFHSADGRVEHGLIDGSGRYTIAGAPLGPVRIAVRSHAAAPTGLPSRGGPPPAAPKELVPTAKDKPDGKFIRIPPRYIDPATSGLTFAVRGGAQKHDIDLTP
jgi:hypothetical protein